MPTNEVKQIIQTLIIRSSRVAPRAPKMIYIIRIQEQGSKRQPQPEHQPLPNQSTCVLITAGRALFKRLHRFEKAEREQKQDDGRMIVTLV